MYPKLQKNFNVRINGLSYSGLATEVKLPDLKIKTEEYLAAGMDGPIPIDMGLEKLEAELTLSEFSSDIAAMFGLRIGAPQVIIVSGQQQDNLGVPSPIVAVFNGGVTDLEFGAWKPAEKAEIGRASCRERV